MKPSIFFTGLFVTVTFGLSSHASQILESDRELNCVERASSNPELSKLSMKVKSLDGKLVGVENVVFELLQDTYGLSASTGNPVALKPSQHSAKNLAGKNDDELIELGQSYIEDILEGMQSGKIDKSAKSIMLPDVQKAALVEGRLGRELAMSRSIYNHAAKDMMDDSFLEKIVMICTIVK